MKEVLYDKLVRDMADSQFGQKQQSRDLSQNL